MSEPHHTSLAELQTRPLPPDFESITGPLPYNLLNDLMFRIVFETNRDALKSLLCSLLHYDADDIAEIEIKNPIRLGKRVKDKNYIYDIYLLLNNNKKIHLELQVAHQDYWAERSLCYLCRDFGNLNAGDTYDKVNPLIQIDILDFDLYEGTEEFFSTYHLANDKTGRIYNDKLTLHVLQLNKEAHATEEDKAYGLDYWAKLFKATTWEELRMLAQQQNDLQSTIETIYRVNADDYVRAELEAREEELRVQRTFDNEMKRRAEKLAEQQKVLNEQKTTISEQRSTINEQQSTIDEQQSTIDEQQSTIDEQQSTIDEQKSQLAEKDAEIARMNAEIARLKALTDNH